MLYDLVFALQHWNLFKLVLKSVKARKVRTEMTTQPYLTQEFISTFDRKLMKKYFLKNDYSKIIELRFDDKNISCKQAIYDLIISVFPDIDRVQKLFCDPNERRKIMQNHKEMVTKHVQEVYTFEQSIC